MKKIIIMLILLLVCFVPALAENTPEVMRLMVASFVRLM